MEEKEKKEKNVKQKKYKGGFQFTPLPKYYSASRELRNQAEKQRRDKLNYHVSELASLVPFVVRAQKKVDKTSVLRLAASYIRMHQILGSGECEKTLPSALVDSDSSRSLLSSIGGFLLVVTNVGKIVYVSEAIEDTFGYVQADVLGQTIFSLIHHDDVKLVEKQLNNTDSSKISFYCRLMEKSVSRNDPGRYEIIHVVGQLKSLPEATSRTKGQSRKRTSSDASDMDFTDDECEDACEVLPSRTGTHMLVSFVQVVRDKPITELTWVESMRDEYITRHRMDGNISYVDHRISFITGLMPDEVRGSSAFMYMHQDDILWSIIAQKQMLDSTRGQGMVTYRLVCKDGSFVSLRSKGFLEVDKETGKVDTFVCINTVLKTKDAEEEVQKQRKALLPILSQNPEDLIKSFTQELPPELSSFIRCLITRQALQRMLNSVDKVSIETDSTGKPRVSSIQNSKVKELFVDDSSRPSTSGISQAASSKIPDLYEPSFRQPASVSHKRKSSSKRSRIQVPPMPISPNVPVIQISDDDSSYPYVTHVASDTQVAEQRPINEASMEIQNLLKDEQPEKRFIPSESVEDRLRNITSFHENPLTAQSLKNIPAQLSYDDSCMGFSTEACSGNSGVEPPLSFYSPESMFPKQPQAFVSEPQYSMEDLSTWSPFQDSTFSGYNEPNQVTSEGNMSAEQYSPSSHSTSMPHHHSVKKRNSFPPPFSEMMHPSSSPRQLYTQRNTISRDDRNSSS